MWNQYKCCINNYQNLVATNGQRFTVWNTYCCYIVYVCILSNKIGTYLNSLILLCKNFLIFHGRSLWPSISGVSCRRRSASRSRSWRGAPGGARSASGPATHAVPATNTSIATQHQRRCHTDTPEKNHYHHPRSSWFLADLKKWRSIYLAIRLNLY